MKCLANVQGYVKLTGFGYENKGVILPFVANDSEGVYIVNNFGNVLHVRNEDIEILS